MNKKGFTLVEILVVISLLAVFTIVTGVTMNRNMKKQQETEVAEFNQKIKGAANLYVSNSSDILTNLYEEEGYAIIRVKELIDSGLIHENLINPSTNKAITGNEQVKVEIDNAGTIVVEYPIISDEGDYLLTKNIILEYKNSNTDVCYSGINTDSLKYVRSDGADTSDYLKSSGLNVNIKCDSSRVNFNAIGTYEIEYEYKTRGGSWRRATRNVIIIDTKPPICPAQETEPIPWTRGPVKKTIVCTDTYNTGLCKEKQIVKEFLNTKYSNVTLEDTSNNSKSCRIVVYSDALAPTISLNATYTNNHESCTIIGTGRDTISGIKYYYLGTNSSINEESIKTEGILVNPTTTSGVSYRITDNVYGTRKYYFYLLDEAGNFAKVSGGKTITIEDKTPPTVVLNVTTSEWTNEDVGLYGYVEDYGSLIKNVTLYNGNISLGGIDYSPGESRIDFPLSDGYKIDDEGEFAIKLTATDNDNIVGESEVRNVRIDKTKPIVDSLSANINGLHFILKDSLSGVSSYCITDTDSSSNCSWTSISSTLETETITVNNPYNGKTIYVFAKDQAGNISSSKSYDTSCIEVIYVDGNCSVQCGGGTYTKRAYDKYIPTIRCESKDETDIPCNTMGCCDLTENCNCGDWSWTNCSADCDGGTKYQTRTCKKCSKYNGELCSGTATENQNLNTPCNTQPCKKDCKNPQANGIVYPNLDQSGKYCWRNAKYCVGYDGQGNCVEYDTNCGYYWGENGSGNMWICFFYG